MRGPSTIPRRSPRAGWASPPPRGYAVSVGPRSAATLTFVIAGSDSTREAALDTYAYLTRHHPSLLAQKQARYAALLQRARVSIPDKRLQQVYDWVRLNTEWLDRDVPGIGRGLGGGLMEYPWWFGTEASYSLQALAAGRATPIWPSRRFACFGTSCSRPTATAGSCTR